METHPTCPSCMSDTGLRSHSILGIFPAAKPPRHCKEAQGSGFLDTHIQLLLTGQWAPVPILGLSVDTRQRLEPPPFGLCWLTYREMDADRPEEPALWGISLPCSPGTLSGLPSAGICSLEGIRTFPLRFSVLVTNLLAIG